MSNLQRLFLNLSAGLLLLAAIALMISNADTETTLTLFGNAYTLSLGTAMAISGLLVGASAGLKLLEQVKKVSQSARKSDRQREKAEVTAEASSDKVKALEAKVETLEKALAKALEKASRSPLR